MRIVLIGDVGSRHVGDDAMFAVALQRLRAHWPSAEIVAMSCNPEATADQFRTAAVPVPCDDRWDEPSALFGFQRALDAAADGAAGAWLPEIDDLHDAAAAIRNADALVVAGGGNINAQWPNHAYGRAAALAIANAQGIPAALTSQTIGPELSETQRVVLRDVLGRAAIIGVRESSSAALLKQLGIPDDRLSHQPDDALAIAPRAVRRWPFGRGRRVILATFSPVADVEVPIDLELAVLERIVALAAREDAVVALCPHTTLDVARHHQLAVRVHHRERVRRLPLLGAAETRWMVGAASAVVTTRYHPLVFALAAGVPAIGLHHGDYTRVRTVGALSHAGVEGFDLSLDRAEQHIDEALTRALRDRPALTETLAQARAVALTRLDDHWERLCASIAPTAPAPRVERSRAALPRKRAAIAVPPLSLVVHPLRIDGPEAIATARLEGTGVDPTAVAFRFPADAADPAVLGDAFVLAFLFPAMSLGRDLHVCADVSTSLVESLEEYQGVWQCWRPATYRRVRITADALRERPPGADRATLFGFSSGLHSSYTAWKLGGSDRRAAGVLALGLDAPLSEPEAERALRDAAAKTLASRGIDLIPLVTDWGRCFATVSWEDASGALVAAVLTMLSGRFSGGLIAATDDVRRFTLPKGSSPAIDPLLGSARFPIRHHGGDTPRLAKLAAVATWPEAFDALRVCRIHGLAANCGRCGHCLTLGAACRALGLPWPRSLPEQPFERSAFAGSGASANGASFVEDALRAAALTEARDPRLGGLAQVLRRWRSAQVVRAERHRLGDLVSAASSPEADRWSRLANGVDRLTRGGTWRHYLRPAIRAIRRRTG